MDLPIHGRLKYLGKPQVKLNGTIQCQIILTHVYYKSTEISVKIIEQIIFVKIQLNSTQTGLS